MALTVEKVIEELKKDSEFADLSDEELKEVAEMEIKAGNIKNYTQSTVEKKKVKKERKVDNDKLELMNVFKDTLSDIGIVSTLENEVRLNFSFNGAEYTVTLTKHRPPKK